MPKPAPSKPRDLPPPTGKETVAVCLPMIASGMEIWRGVQECFLTSGNHLMVTHPTFGSDLANRLQRINRLSGIIAFASNKEIEDSMVGLGVPVISVSGRVAGSRLRRVRVDEQETGRMAARYLLDAGFEEAVGYISSREANFDLERIKGMREELALHGLDSRLSIREPRGSLPTKWLKDARRPLLVVVSQFHLVYQIMLWMVDHSAEIKTEIGLLCLDDPHGSRDWRPGMEISAVKLPWKQVGFRAATTLIDWIGSGKPPPPEQLVAGHELLIRASTRRSRALPPIASAVNNWLETAYDPGTGVEEIAGILGYSISGIYKNFQQAFGHSLGEELARRRHLHARRLLANSHLPVKAIAGSCGYSNPSAFIEAFRKREGMTPTRWRQKN